jgi:hypothetical protein
MAQLAKKGKEKERKGKEKKKKRKRTGKGERKKVWGGGCCAALSFSRAAPFSAESACIRSVPIFFIGAAFIPQRWMQAYFAER